MKSSGSAPDKNSTQVLDFDDSRSSEAVMVSVTSHSSALSQEDVASAGQHPPHQLLPIRELLPVRQRIVPYRMAHGMSHRMPHKKKRSFWPAAILAMGVVMAAVGFKAYRKTQQAGSLASGTNIKATQEQSRLPVRVAKARNGLAQAWGG